MTTSALLRLIEKLNGAIVAIVIVIDGRDTERNFGRGQVIH